MTGEYRELDATALRAAVLSGERTAEQNVTDAFRAIAEQDGVRALVPGQPEASALLERIRSHDGKMRMPPPRSKKPPLTAEQVGLVRRWIAQGAVWSGATTATAASIRI